MLLAVSKFYLMSKSLQIFSRVLFFNDAVTFGNSNFSFSNTTVSTKPGTSMFRVTELTYHTNDFVGIHKIHYLSSGI